MLDEANVRDALRQIIMDENAEAKLEEDADFKADLRDIGVDSMGLMMTTLKLTEAYGITFSDADLDELATADDIVKRILEHSS